MAQGKPPRRVACAMLGKIGNGAPDESRAEIFRNNLFRETEIGAMIFEW